jgi:LmbE family N-acetylglucosaminyl deacetylase
MPDIRHALRLMAVLAHPDDESLGVGGTLARYAAEGVETYLVTATRGEGGRYRGVREGPEYPGRERLAEIRELELRAAARVLGLREVSLLGYGDGVLDRADPREAIGRIAGHVRRVRPQVVLSFGPDGAYGHPDHVAISQLSAAAIVAAADPGYTHDPATAALPPHAVSKFYYMASSAEFSGLYEDAFRKLTSQVDGVERDPPPWPDWEITTWLDTRAFWPTVWKAASCHESQVSAYEKLARLTPAEHERLWGTECFYRVFSTVNGGRTREHDLFEGLRAVAASGASPASA